MSAASETTQLESCYCTLLTSDSYTVGAQALILSLLKHSKAEDKRDIIVLHLSSIARISLRVLSRLSPRVKLRQVERIQGPSKHLNRTVEAWADYTKLHIWGIIEYNRIVYLDADMLIMDDISDLFDRDLGSLGLAAAPDVFPPDRFNAGLLVIKPDTNLCLKLLEEAPKRYSYDGGDTGFLNSFFPNWFASPEDNRLPFCYNAQRTLHWVTFKGQPGYWEAIGPKKVLHFSSSPKPWLDSDRKGDLEMIWWSTFTDLVAAHRAHKKQ